MLTGLEMLSNLILPKLNEHFHNKLENGMSNVYGGCKLESHTPKSKAKIDASF